MFKSCFYCGNKWKSLILFRKLLSSHHYMRYHGKWLHMSFRLYDPGPWGGAAGVQGTGIAVVCHLFALHSHKRAAPGIKSSTLNVGTALWQGCAPCHLLCLRYLCTGYQNAAAVWIVSSWMTLSWDLCCLLMMMSFWLCQIVTSNMHWSGLQLECDAVRMRISPCKSGTIILSSEKGGLLSPGQRETAAPLKTFNYLGSWLIWLLLAFSVSLWFFFLKCSLLLRTRSLLQPSNELFST